MRPMLFMVLAFWLLCESRGHGKHGMGVQGILSLDVVHRREKFSMLTLEVPDGMASNKLPNKPTRHIVPRLSLHDSGSGANGVVPLDIADTTAGNKQSLFLDGDVAHVLPHDTERRRQGQMIPFVEAALDTNMNVSKYGVERMLSLESKVPASLHQKGWRGQSHTSLSQPVEGTSADTRASYGEHFYVHNSSQDGHAVRTLSDSVRLGAEGHISQLDVIPQTETDKLENAVRRQGVDSALLKYSTLTLSADPRTGVMYDVGLPPSLTGIRAQAIRLDYTTFMRDGLTFNEFSLPPGVSFDTTGTFVAMVYRKISNFTVYTLPPQYDFGGPVIGIISSVSNVMSLDPSSPPANISLPPNVFINISLPMSSSDPISNALCAFMAANGSIFVSSLASLPNICVSSTLGDFALVRQTSSTSSPAQNLPQPPPGVTSSPLTSANSPSSSSTTSKPTTNWKLGVGATCLALAGLAFVVALVLVSFKLGDNFKLFFTSRRTGNEEALENSLIGNSKAPSAGVLRTKPALEIDMAHFTNQLDA